MGLILAFLGTVLLALFIRLLGVEIAAHHVPLCNWLVKVAAARLPADQRVAAESEWLQVINDLRSPTRQMLHSLSFVVSAFRIRRAIQPQPRISVFKAVLYLQLMISVGASAVAVLLMRDAHMSQILRQLLPPVSKPLLLVIVIACVVAWATTLYMTQRLLGWMLTIVGLDAGAPGTPASSCR